MTLWSRPAKLNLVVLAVAMFATTLIICGSNRAEAVIAIIRTTGMFSVAQGQATVAHVVNTGTNGERSIVISWNVLDAVGNTLAQSEQTVEAGQTASFEFRPPDLAPGQRIAIRFVLTVKDRHKPDFVATQEVFNTGDGRTTAFLPYLEQ